MPQQLHLVTAAASRTAPAGSSNIQGKRSATAATPLQTSRPVPTICFWKAASLRGCPLMLRQLQGAWPWASLQLHVPSTPDHHLQRQFADSIGGLDPPRCLLRLLLLKVPG